jgi:uncharacterized CHY-type Zn-finger protein
MTTPILIVCPKCHKQIKAPEEALGKKVRCKFCQAAFVAKEESGKLSSAKAVKPAKAPAKKAKADDEDANPYSMVDVNLAPRCPECANEIAEGQVLCLHCGYNMRTREFHKTRKVYDLSFMDHFRWLLPGIGCALAVLSIIGFNIWYLLKIDDVISWENDSFFLGMWTIKGIKLWVVITSLFLIWFAGKFAVRRLIFHPKPPEIEKKK